MCVGRRWGRRKSVRIMKVGPLSWLCSPHLLSPHIFLPHLIFWHSCAFSDPSWGVMDRKIKYLHQNYSEYFHTKLIWHHWRQLCATIFLLINPLGGVRYLRPSLLRSFPSLTSGNWPTLSDICWYQWKKVILGELHRIQKVLHHSPFHLPRHSLFL